MVGWLESSEGWETCEVFELERHGSGVYWVTGGGESAPCCNKGV